MCAGHRGPNVAGKDVSCELVEAVMQSVTRAGEYVNAGGLRTYYEVHGTGEPLVLLHGGLCTVETLDGLTPVLAGAVPGVHAGASGARAHPRRGRTADVSEHGRRHESRGWTRSGYARPGWSASATAGTSRWRSR